MTLSLCTDVLAQEILLVCYDDFSSSSSHSHPGLVGAGEHLDAWNLDSTYVAITLESMCFCFIVVNLTI
jgi:hypothetical protein